MKMENAGEIRGIMSMNEVFTVIVLLYNNHEYLHECLDSILMQEYGNIEIIVADDGSKSFNQKEILDYIRNNNKGNIRNYLAYTNECNLGTVKSVNRALKKTTGAFIKLLAADDALYDEKSLSNAYEALRESPCGIVTGDAMKCDQFLKPVKKYKKRLTDQINSLSPHEIFCKLCIHNDIVAGGVFFSKSFFEQYGVFDESYRLLEDWPKWLEVTKNGCKFIYRPFYAVKYRCNRGIGTSYNPMYMQDKKTVLSKIIKPSRKIIGTKYYLMSLASFMFINSKLVRRAYSIVFRNRM